MLKIKDNVDLKKLEKYGFESVDRNRFLNKYSYTSNCGTITYRIWVHKEDRCLSIHNATNAVFDVLYNLIKDGLVEKVGK